MDQKYSMLYVLDTNSTNKSKDKDNSSTTKRSDSESSNKEGSNASED